MSLCLAAPANNGMHPTADPTPVIFGILSGRRVMPSVRFLLNDRTQEMNKLS